MPAPAALAQVLVQVSAQVSVQAPTAAQVQVEVAAAAAQVPRRLAGPKEGEVVGQQEPESHLQVVRQEVGQEAHSARRQALQQEPRQELDMQALDIHCRATPCASSP